METRSFPIIDGEYHPPSEEDGVPTVPVIEVTVKRNGQLYNYFQGIGAQKQDDGTLKFFITGEAVRVEDREVLVGTTHPLRGWYIEGDRVYHAPFPDALR
jgi:hypothetical protein